jgi:hypothetical protein
MCTPAFPWKLMPGFMGVIQFSWRMLGFFLVFDSLICGINAYLVIKDIRHLTYFSSIIIIGVIMVLGTARTFKYYQNFDLTHDKMYESNTKAAILNYNNVNKEYLPIKASNNMRYMLYRPNGLVLLDYDLNTDIMTSIDELLENPDNQTTEDTNFEIINEEKVDLYYKCDISGIEDRTKFELPFLYYPGYQVTLNGDTVETFESNNGFLSCTIDKDGHIEAKYVGTKLEKAGYIISFVGVMLLIIYVSFEKKQRLDYDGMINQSKTSNS